MSRFAKAALVIVLAVTGSLLAGLATAAAADCPPPKGRAFEHTRRNLRAMGQELLVALARRDEARLRQISISEREFRELYWPHNPNSKPPNSLSAELAWSMYAPKYERGLQRLLEKHGGTAYRLRAVGVGDEREASEAFVIHQTSWIEVEDASGKVERLRLFGAVIEQCGRFKIYGYVTD